MRELKFKMLKCGEPTIQYTHSSLIAEEFKYLRNEIQEHFYVVVLDVGNRIIGKHLVHKGSQEAVQIYPRDVIRAILLAGGIRVIFVHNHPSGNQLPSDQDNKITEKLGAACSLLQIDFLDHIIIGDNYFSYQDSTNLPMKYRTFDWEKRAMIV